MAIKARRCFVPLSPSDWVHKVFLTCDNQLAVQFNRGMKTKRLHPHGPGAFIGSGGVPEPFCCLYTGIQGEMAEELYELALVFPFAGEWVRRFLYKKLAYTRVAPPATCGSCNTTCTLQVNPAAPTNGQAVTIACTVTNNDGSPTKGEAPEGTVTFYVDGTSIGAVTLPEDEPDSKNSVMVSKGWTATCQPQATHTISAAYTPSTPDWTSTSCSTSVTVGNCGVSVGCCGGSSIPTTVHATISGCACINGTYPLSWTGTQWQGTFDASACGHAQGMNLILSCPTGGAACTDMQLRFQCNSSSFSTVDSPQAGCACNPLNLVFSFTQSAGEPGSPCCPNTAITVTITP